MQGVPIEAMPGHRRGGRTRQTGPRRRNPKGARSLRPLDGVARRRRCESIDSSSRLASDHRSLARDPTRLLPRAIRGSGSNRAKTYGKGRRRGALVRSDQNRTNKPGLSGCGRPFSGKWRGFPLGDVDEQGILPPPQLELDGAYLFILLFFFQFSLFLWTKLGLFLLFPFAFIFTSLITHICFSWIEN